MLVCLMVTVFDHHKGYVHLVPTYVYDPLAAPRVEKGGPDSNRRFLKKLQKNIETWNERQESGSIPQKRPLC